MKLLAIDTATEAFSVALLVDNDIVQSYQIAPQQQAGLLLPMVDKLLGDAGLTPRALDGLVFGQGPGSFTGVRIATAAVQGIAMGVDCGAIGISTLAAVAHRAWREHSVTHCVATIDARMKQIYWGRYITTGEAQTTLQGIEQVSDPVDIVLPSSEDSWLCAGTGATQYHSLLREQGLSSLRLEDAELDNAVLPTAYDMLLLAQDGFARGAAVPAEQVTPVYLRDKVALTEAERATSSPSGNLQ